MTNEGDEIGIDATTAGGPTFEEREAPGKRQSAGGAKLAITAARRPVHASSILLCVVSFFAKPEREGELGTKL